MRYCRGFFRFIEVPLICMHHYN